MNRPPRCPKCNGWFVRQVEIGCLYMLVDRCFNCGYREYPEGDYHDEDGFDGALALIAVVNAQNKSHQLSMPLLKKVAVDRWNEEWQHTPPRDFTD